MMGGGAYNNYDNDSDVSNDNDNGNSDNNCIVTAAFICIRSL